MTRSPDIASQYARMQITTAGVPGVICMLHYRCCQFINQALAQTPSNRELLDRAQNILVTLERSLNSTDELTEGLFYLYDYCYCRLQSNSAEDHNDAAEIMVFLRDTFDKLHQPVKAGIVITGHQPGTK